MRDHHDHELQVLLVCTANVCRSPLAEAILRSRLDEGAFRISVRSAGLHAAGRQPACQVALDALLGDATARRALLDHRPQQLKRREVAHADLIITATRAQRVHVVRIMPTVRGHVFTLNEAARLVGPARATLPAHVESDEAVRLIVPAMNRLRARLPAPHPAEGAAWYRRLRQSGHTRHADDVLDTHGGPIVPHNRTVAQVVAAATTIAEELGRAGASTRS